MNEWTLYAITRLDDVRWVFFVVGMAALIVGTISVTGWGLFAMEGDESPKLGCRKTFFISVPVTLTLFFIHALIPTQKDAMIIFAAPYALEAAKAVTENKDAREVPANVAKLINGLVKEWTPKKRIKNCGF